VFKLLMAHMHGRARWCFFLAPAVMLVEVFSDLQ
jgi:hypothetical protein